MQHLQHLENNINPLKNNTLVGFSFTTPATLFPKNIYITFATSSGLMNDFFGDHTANDMRHRSGTLGEP